jgi:Family of unknown function (DUF6491)
MYRSITAAFLGAALAVAVATPAAADLPAVLKKSNAEVAIPFANHGGIRNWQVIDRDSILIQDTHGQWYLAKLMSSAFDLPFVEAIGFKTNPSGSFDRFSSVIVKGQAYAIVSLVRTDPPAKKKRTK